MEPDDVSQIAQFLRGQNLANSDCDLVLDGRVCLCMRVR